jgi:hypothetical protein
MELLTIICETACDDEIMRLLDEVGAPGYTKIPGATGMGATGRREGSTVWPGRNTIYLVAIESEQAQVFIEKMEQTIREQSKTRRIAIKVFAQPVTVRI